MNKGQRTITGLLTVACALLALNLLAANAPRAEAQPLAPEPLAGDGDPIVVRWLPLHSRQYYRVWSDGQVDYFQRSVGDPCEEFEFLNVVLPAADHPFPVVDADLKGTSTAELVFVLEFADGRVDFVTLINLADVERCTIAGEGSPFHCLGDTDRSGEIDFTDLITVLSQWGQCKG